MNNSYLIGGILIVQFLCAFFFVFEIFVAAFGVFNRPLSWQIVEFIEFGAALGLVLGVILSGVAMRLTILRRRSAERKLRIASTAFTQLLEENFTDWQLTAAEADVALFLIKGMSLAEVASLRDTSEGTVKAQSNAIYRKAGVSGRTQLLSLFIEDLMDENLRIDVQDQKILVANN